MQPQPEPPLGRFALRLVLWLLPCFVLWHLLADVLLWPLAVLVDALLQLTLAQAFAGVAIDGRSFMFDTHLVMRMADGRYGSPMFALNPLSYTWNLPVLYALLLAGNSRRRLVQRLALGGLLLLPAWAWGVCFQFTKTLAFDLGPDVARQFAAPGAWLDLLALAYQFGVLVLPATALVLAWAALGRDDLTALAGMAPGHADPPATRARAARRRGAHRSRRSATRRR